MLIEPLDQAVRKRIYEVSDAAHQKFQSSVRPIFRALKGERLELFGSCLLLQVDGTKYIATAAHIADSIPESRLYVAGTENTQPVQIVGTIYSTKAPSADRKRDKLDIAFAILSDDAAKRLGAVTFTNANAICHNQASPAHRRYMAIGYPISRNKGKINHQEHSMKLVSWRYVAGVSNIPALETELGVSGDYHFFQTYSKYSKDAEGNKVSSVSPRGLSGGALVDLGNFSSMQSFESAKPFSGTLAGMVIEKHKSHSALVAVYIQKVIEAIRL